MSPRSPSARPTAHPGPDSMSPEEEREVARKIYERSRLKGTELRKREKERRRAKRPPVTLDDAIRDHWAAKYGSRTVADASDEVDDLASVEDVYVESTVEPRPIFRFVKDRSAEHAAALREALALPFRERLTRFGFLLGVPFGCDIPESLVDEDTRWELPEWSLAAKYDVVRDEYFGGLVAGTVDQATLDAELVKRGVKPRSIRPDEVGLSADQRAHLQRLRRKLKTALQIHEANAKANARPETMARCRSYVEAAEKAIAEARVAYGLPAEELP